MPPKNPPLLAVAPTPSVHHMEPPHFNNGHVLQLPLPQRKPHNNNNFGPPEPSRFPRDFGAEQRHGGSDRHEARNDRFWERSEDAVGLSGSGLNSGEQHGDRKIEGGFGNSQFSGDDGPSRDNQDHASEGQDGEGMNGGATGEQRRLPEDGFEQMSPSDQDGDRPPRHFQGEYRPRQQRGGYRSEYG